MARGLESPETVTNIGSMKNGSFVYACPKACAEPLKNPGPGQISVRALECRHVKNRITRFGLIKGD